MFSSINVAYIYVTEINVELRRPSPVQNMIHQKQLEIVEYFKYFVSLITNSARCNMWN
jgi:hypothetical protein